MIKHWLKSRYTRSLEERVVELKLQISALREELAAVNGRNVSLTEHTASLREQIVSLKAKIDMLTGGQLTAADIARISAERKRAPRSVNFIQGRDWLEEQSKAGHGPKEITPEEAEKEAAQEKQ